MKITESIKVIKKILADPERADNHDPLLVATTYAGQTQVVNERLKKCLALIKKNMVPQAIEEASYDPHLIDLCNEMSGTIPDAWRKLCKEKGWPVHADINMEAFNELMNSFSMESTMEPLLRQLRRANNQGHIGQCVAILRDIVKKDPNNPEWKSDLAEFETVYLDKIKQDIEEFRQEKNVNGVARLIVELKQQWSIPTDSISVQEMENFIESQYRENLVQEEQEIAGKIGISFQSGNVEALGDAIAAYNNLGKNRYFKPDPSLQVIYANALHWYEQQLKAIEIQKNYDSKIVQINDRIARSSHEGIKSLWEELQRFPFPVPEELEPDVMMLIRKEQRAKIRRQRKKQMGYVMILLFAMVCIFFAATWNYHRQIKNRLVADLDDAVALENIIKSNEVIDDMLGRKIAFINTALFNKNEIEKQQNKAKELALLLERKRATFRVLIVELESMAAKGFPESIEETEGKIKAIQSVLNAVTPDNIVRLQLVQAAWQERKRVIKQMEEKELSAIFDKITSRFSNIISAITKEDVDANEKTFQQIEKLLAQGVQLTSVSDAMKKSLGEFKKQMDLRKEIMTIRKGQINEIMQAPSFDSYIRALKTFSGTFSDDIVTKNIASTIEMEKLYNQLLSMPDMTLSANAPEKEDSEESDENRENNNKQKIEYPENPFWSSTYEVIKTLGNNIRIHKDEVIEELKRMERTPRFVDLWECTVNKPNFEPEKWYFNGKPVQEFIKGIKSYAGIAYILSPDDLQPQFKANNAITIQVEDLKKMPHCDVVQQMLNNISYDIGMESIMQEIKNIYGQQFSPILKLHLISFLTDQLFTLVGKENALPFIEMANDFKRFNNQVNWLCTANSKYSAESRQAQMILTHHLQRPDRMNEYIAQWKIQQATMRRPPRWVGFADLKNPAQLHFKTGKIPNEVWVVRNGNTGRTENITEDKESKNRTTPLIFMTEEQSMGERAKYLEHNGYLPGEPLFAPYDNNTTREVLASILEDLGFDRQPDITWPVTWPVNMRKPDFRLKSK